MTEEELITRIAELWVENGGDKDGLYWCLDIIAKKIQELIDKKEPK